MKNVLLIDNDTVCNLVNKKRLEQSDLVNAVRVVVNGQDALKMFTTHFNVVYQPPDLILLDLDMPVMDGFGFLEGFKKLKFQGKEKIKIVVLSSSQRDEDVSKAKALGASDFLLKPIGDIELLGLL